MTDKWQLYSQTGVDGPEYGVRIRPGYTVVGFQKEDAKEIIGLRDEVERKQRLIAVGEHKNARLEEQIEALVIRCKKAETEVERLRSELTTANVQLMAAGEMVCAKDARVASLRSEITKGKETLADCWKLQDEQAARIKELEADKRRLEARVEYCHDQTKLIELLEAAFLDHLAARLYYERYRLNRSLWADYPEEPCQMRPKEDFRQDAREALEEIKNGMEN